MISELVARARSLWRGLVDRSRVEAEMEEEFQHHVELRTEHLVGDGLSRREARRRARLEFGHTERHRDQARASRGLRGLDQIRFSLLDFKLGLRMLVKYPGLTVVGGLAMAFAIWVGAVTFEVVNQILSPVLPLDEGERIVAVLYWDIERNRSVAPFLGDYVAWRGEVETIHELGAYRDISRNFVLPEGVPEPVVVAEISADGFRVPRVAPLLGRTLLDADEEVGAPSVVVIGFDVWQSRFAGDPEVIGRSVGLGGAVSTVVGVMPEGFAFPLSHGVWVPLRRSSVGLEPGQGGRVVVFGRLAPSVDAVEAQAELDALGARRAQAFPEALGRMRPRVMPYARGVSPLPEIGPVGLLAANVFVVMLLILICGNIALLMFARAATRDREIAVRSALGAGRGRIVLQLFSEALVLASIAAIVGLVAASFGVSWYSAMSEADSGRPPFWARGGLGTATVFYLCGLTLVGAAVAGVGPGIKVTGGRVEPRLRQSSAGIGGLQLSGVWSGVIVAQVAVTVAFPATAFVFQRFVANMQSVELGVSAEAYLSARLEMDESGLVTEESTVPESARSVRWGSAYEELEERLTNEPGVLGVTFGDGLPGSVHPQRRVEIEEAGSAPGDPHLVGVAAVDVDFFRHLDASIRVGRGFTASDLESDLAVVIVNQAFVDEVLEGRSAVGRRMRYAVRGDRAPRPWLEIVGVVGNLGMIGGNDLDPSDDPGFYRPLARGVAYPLHIAVHVRGDAEAFAPRLRAVAVAVDPSLRLHDVRRLDEISDSLWLESQFLYRLLTGVSLVALILSLTGIYSVMSFAVSRRTREIGVRVALGSDRRRIVASIFRRPLFQVVAGIGMGAVLVSLLALGVTGGMTAREASVVILYCTVMFGVCMLACVVPTRRALRVEPTQALRAEG